MSSDRSIGGRLARKITPSTVRRRFAYKLGVLLLIVVVVLALVGSVGYVRANNSVEDNADQQMQSVASIQSNGVGDWIQESIETLESDSHVHSATVIPGTGPGTDWLLITTVPKSVAFQTANIVGQSMLGVVGVGLIALLGITVVIGRQTARPLTRLRDKAQTMEQGNLDVDLQTSRINEIGQLYDGFGSMRDALRDQIREAETARQAAEEAKQETQRTNEQLERKADEYSEVMRECAQGDLTQRMDPDSDNEAMESIAREFNEMIGAIEETTAHVK